MIHFDNQAKTNILYLNDWRKNHFLQRDLGDNMYIDDYKRWLQADLEDPTLTAELQKIEGQNDEIHRHHRMGITLQLKNPLISSTFCVLVLRSTAQ